MLLNELSAGWPAVEIDVPRHNLEVRHLWAAFEAGDPDRVPTIFGSTPRILLLDPAYNPEGVSFQEYFENPRIMFTWQVMHADWVRSCLVQDAEMGVPAAGWEIGIDFQNVPEAAWLGNEIIYMDGQVPDTLPSLAAGDKWQIFDQEPPDPFDRIMGRFLEYFEVFTEYAKTFEYKGVGIGRVRVPHGDYTDGPFTSACKLRGLSNFCLDLAIDPEYAHQLLAYITEATIERLHAWRGRFPLDPRDFKLADDLIMLISEKDYVEFVLPCHARLYESLLPDGCERFMHLCGDHARFFPLMHERLSVTIFDTGFPLDFGSVRRQVGPEVLIQGGPSVQTLLSATPRAVEGETRRILASGITEGGRFILREANDLAPGTPLENTRAMYEAARRYGVY